MAELQQGLRRVALFDRQRFARLADGLAVALAAALPWSTSAVEILSVLLLVAIIPTLDGSSLRRVLSTPGGGLPVAIFVLALVGMLWAFDATMAERWGGLKSFLKLLFIPLLIIHFSRSERGSWVLIGFVVSCVLLLTVSWAFVMFPGLVQVWQPRIRLGVPVKDYIAQSGEFIFCAFVLAKIALDAWRARRTELAIGLLLLAALFLFNILYISTSRTVLVVIPVLLVLFAYRYLSRRGGIIVLLAAVVAGALSWSLAPLVRTGVTDLVTDIRNYDANDPNLTSGALRIEFWKKSIEFVAAAPVIGHGTGSIRELYRQSAIGKTGAAGAHATNPHNQTFVVAVQFGLVGTALLYAMWLAHLLLFRGPDLLAWTGFVIVVQNIVGSLFNSHISDFTQGWGYVIGVGVAAGMVLKNSAAARPT